MVKNSFEQTDMAKRLAAFHMPRYRELSDFDVYMDQLVQILDKYLAEFLIPGEEKVLTPSMINNYVQQKVILPPVKKKYNKLHIVYLMVIGILKQVLSISEIVEILRMAIEEYPVEAAYDYFCQEIENALKATFETRTFDNIAHHIAKKKTLLSEYLRSAVLAFSNRIYVKKNIYYINSLKD